MGNLLLEAHIGNVLWGGACKESLIGGSIGSLYWETRLGNLLKGGTNKESLIERLT